MPLARQTDPRAERRSPLLRIRTQWIAVAALVVAGLVPVVWPGDVPFINDEPQLVAGAVNANRAWKLAAMGLPGTFGFVYGPAPTWVYQVLLGTSHDLVIVTVLHTLVMSAATAAALWWLARSLGLWIWFAPLPLLSPYYWFYARVLWDNPFLLPLGALAVAGYAAHLASGSRSGLRVALAAALTMPLVHLIGVALAAPLLAHMAIVRRRSLWAQRYSVAAIAGAVFLLAFPYWRYLATSRPAPAPARPIDGWLFPLFGGRLLSARDLDYFYGPEPVAGALYRAAAAVSSLSHVLVWCGIAVAFALIVRALRARSWTPRAHVAAIVLASLACQSVIHGMSAKFEHPHYYNGTWISFVVLAWLAIDVLATRDTPVRWAAPAATGLLSASAAAAVVALAIGLHRSSGTREVYGATLANQQQVVRALGKYSPDSDVTCRVVLWNRYPHTLDVLRHLNQSDWPGLTRGRFEIRYATPDPASGAIEVVAR